MKRFHVWLAIGGLLAFAGVPAALRAQGFSVNEHSTCAMGRAGTGVARPCDDGSAMFHNPAGLAGIPRGRTQITLGGTFIAPSGDFTEDATGLSSSLNDKVFPVPAVFLTHGFSGNVAAGLGVFAPYGLTTDWPTNSIGRFASYKAVIRNIYVQPTLAARLGRYFKVGAGFDLNFVHLELRQRIDLSEQNTTTPGVTFANLGIPAGTDFADGRVSGGKTGVGYHVGLTIEPTDRISIGARYLSRQKIDDIAGDAKFRQINTGILIPPGSPLIPALGVPAGTPLDAVLAVQFQPGGPLVNQDGVTGVRLPEQFTVGVSFRPTDKLHLLFDYGLQNWEVWDTIVLDFDLLGPQVLPQDFKKTNTFRFGGEYAVGGASIVRAGFLTHDGASPDHTVTPTLPEGDRSEFTVGFGTRLGGNGHVDLAYQYIDQADRRGRSGGPGTPNNGLYSFKAHLFGATISWNF
jgi:long-chain fatty acid transport protein